jgi:membrane protein YqaA with SNARE-associated domain
MPTGKFKISLNDESKAIATITTFLSAVIQKVPSEIGIKEYLLILSGFLGYFLYHLGASCKNFFTTHIFSLWYASYRIKKYMKEFNERLLHHKKEYNCSIKKGLIRINLHPSQPPHHPRNWYVLL